MKQLRKKYNCMRNDLYVEMGSIHLDNQHLSAQEVLKIERIKGQIEVLDMIIKDMDEKLTGRE